MPLNTSNLVFYKHLKNHVIFNILLFDFLKIQSQTLFSSSTDSPKAPDSDFS